MKRSLQGVYVCVCVCVCVYMCARLCTNACKGVLYIHYVNLVMIISFSVSVLVNGSAIYVYRKRELLVHNI